MIVEMTVRLLTDSRSMVREVTGDTGLKREPDGKGGINLVGLEPKNANEIVDAFTKLALDNKFLLKETGTGTPAAPQGDEVQSDDVEA